MKFLTFLICLVLSLNSILGYDKESNILYKNEWLTYYEKDTERLEENSSMQGNYSYYNALRINCKDEGRYCEIIAQYKGDFKFAGFEDLYVPELLNITLVLNSKKEFRIKIADLNKKLFEYPEGRNEELNIDYPFPYDKQNYKEADISNSEYKVMIYQNPFYFKVYRRSTGECLFDTSLGQLFLSEKYITLTSQISSQDIFGLGERFHGFKVKNGSYHIYTEDNPSKPEASTRATYGSYPIYLVREQSNKYHSVYLRNIADMEVHVNTDGNIKSIKYEVIGSIFDFKFFFGENPEEVTELYQEYVGGYTIMPFWSFGYQHCRWGYKDSTEMLNVFKGYHKYNIPIDVYWYDIDYLDNYQIYAMDMTKFRPAELSELKYDTMGYSLRGVAIIDPSISATPLSTNFWQGEMDYKFYKSFWDGIANDVFFKSQTYNNWPYLGKQWAGPVYYPDFVNPDSADYWERCLSDFLSDYMQYNGKPLIEGMWLDMNEIGHFVWGRYNMSAELDGDEYVAEKSYDCLLEQKEYPWVPEKECPSKKTIPSNQRHIDGATEIYYHSSYAMFECQQSKKAGRKAFNTKLPFILTRSQTVGSGRFATHWLGDDYATFSSMKVSIGGIQRSNFYGMPLAGSDICGFIGDTNKELCARWAQLGSLYPFSRNHNVIDAIPNDPWHWGVQDTFKKNYDIRYSILTFYYSLFLQKNAENMSDEFFKGSHYMPPFYNYPSDEELYSDLNIDDTFMIGKSLISFPILYQGETTRLAYFPKGDDFFDFHVGHKVIPNYATNRYMNITNLYTELTPLYQVGGSIIPRQKIKATGYNTDLFNTDDHEAFSLQIALKQSSEGLSSNGVILTLRDLSNIDNVYNYCVNRSNCIQKIQIDFTNDKMEININAISPETITRMQAKDTNLKTFFHNIETLSFLNSGYGDAKDSGLENNVKYNIQIQSDSTLQNDLYLQCVMDTTGKKQACNFYNRVGDTKAKVYLGYSNIKMTLSTTVTTDNPKFLSQQ